MPRTNALKITTPEGVEFSLPLAGPMVRFLAFAVDAACIIAAARTAETLILGFGWINLDFARALSIIAYFVLSVGYGIVLEWLWRGQTVGKKLLGLWVMDAQGLRVRFSQIMIRNLLRFVDMLPIFYMVGGISCAASKKAQRLGDIAANTVVIKRIKAKEPDLTQLLADKFNSFREHPRIVARLRRLTSPREAHLALQALLRRNDLKPQARIELFAAVADRFKTLAPFPEETVFSLTDEQYLRNVVDVLFRSRS